MALQKDDFTEEQWAEIQATIDRARTEASMTARKNAEKAFAAELEAKIQMALEEERAKLQADEQGKLEIERKKLEQAKAALAAERKTLAASKKLINAGFSDEAIEQLLPLFINVDDKEFDNAVDTFIKVNKDLVKAQVDATKVELLKAATPPVTQSNAPVDINAAVQDALKQGDEVAAVELLLKAATTTQ